MVSRSESTVLLEVLMGLLGVDPYVCRDTELVLRLTKANIFLQATSLSTSALVCVDQLFPQFLCMCNQLFLKYLYSSAFSWGVHEANLTEKDVASTRIGSIVVSLLVFFICVRLIFVQ